MENKKLDEKIKIVVGEILGRADPVSKKVLTAFDPSKDAPANQRLLKKFSRNELDIFAEFLKIPLINIQTKEKLFSNRDKLTKRIILEITALYPTTCDECSQEYCVTSDKIPLVRCYICLQGSHDCEDITARIESMRSSSIQVLYGFAVAVESLTTPSRHQTVLLSLNQRHQLRHQQPQPRPIWQPLILSLNNPHKFLGYHRLSWLPNWL